MRVFTFDYFWKIVVNQPKTYWKEKGKEKAINGLSPNQEVKEETLALNQMGMIYNQE